MKLSIRLVALLVLPLVCCSRRKDKADEALDQAQQFAAQGKFEEALQKHIWYHDHALEINQAHYGVRLSFALSYWVELGKKYPKALEALKDIRDKKVARLVAGENNWLLFHEIVAINHELGESKATVELFKKIEVAQPEFASSDWGLNYAQTSRYPARSRQSFEIIFSREVVRIIVVLDQTGDGDLARQIQSDALAAVDTAPIKNALPR